MLTTINGEIDSNTTILGDFNTPLSPMDRADKMKINKEVQALNDTLNKMDLIDIYRIPSQNNRIHLVLKSSWNTLQDRSDIGSQIKPKFKKIEIISSIFSNQNAMRLDINYRRKTVKKTKNRKKPKKKHGR